MTPLATLLRTVTTHGLESMAAPARAPGSVDDAGWAWFRAELDRERLSGLAVAAHQDGALLLSDTQADELADLDQRWQAHALRVEHLTLAATRCLDDAGIGWRVIKGPALARTIYAAPQHRIFGDLDLLVGPSSFGAARTCLVDGLGASDPLPELRPGFDARFAKDALLRVDGVELDLHRTIAPGPFGLRLPLVELQRGGRPFVLADQELMTLGGVPGLVQVCANAALGDVPARLSNLRDVAQAVHHERADVAEVVGTARRWRLDAVVAHAVTETWRRLQLAEHPLATWAADHRPRRMDRQLLAASVSTRRSYTRQAAAVVAVPGLADKLRYTGAILAPQRQYLDARGWRRDDHVRRGWRRLTAARRSR